MILLETVIMLICVEVNAVLGINLQHHMPYANSPVSGYLFLYSVYQESLKY